MLLGAAAFARHELVDKSEIRERPFDAGLLQRLPGRRGTRFLAVFRLPGHRMKPAPAPRGAPEQEDLHASLPGAQDPDEGFQRATRHGVILIVCGNARVYPW